MHADSHNLGDYVNIIIDYKWHLFFSNLNKDRLDVSTETSRFYRISRFLRRLWNQESTATLTYQSFSLQHPCEAVAYCGLN